MIVQGDLEVSTLKVGISRIDPKTLTTSPRNLSRHLSGLMRRRWTEGGTHRRIVPGHRLGCGHHAFCEEAQNEQSWKTSGVEHLASWDILDASGQYLYGDWVGNQGHPKVPTSCHRSARVVHGAFLGSQGGSMGQWSCREASKASVICAIQC